MGVRGSPEADRGGGRAPRMPSQLCRPCRGVGEGVSGWHLGRGEEGEGRGPVSHQRAQPSAGVLLINKIRLRFLLIIFLFPHKRSGRRGDKFSG